MNVTLELDHVFVCCSVGAPERRALLSLGLKEGSPNRHPGQGTACRRFFFHSTYLELIWVSDSQEARSEAVRPTRLWDRWLGRTDTACPFGIVLRPSAAAGEPVLAFPTWAYRPAYLPPQMTIEIAQDTPLSEPGFFFLRSHGDRAHFDREPRSHRPPTHELSGVRILAPTSAPLSRAAASVQAAGVVTFDKADQYSMELSFGGASQEESADLRPDLPIVLRW